MNGNETHIVDVGSHCAVLFEASSTALSQRGKEVAPKGKSSKVTTNEFWIGRVQMIRRKGTSGWQKNRDPINLLDRPPDGTVQFHMYWYKPLENSKVKFSYDTNVHKFVEFYCCNEVPKRSEGNLAFTCQR